MDKIEFVINEDNKILADSIFQLIELIQDFQSWLLFNTLINAEHVEVKIMCEQMSLILKCENKFSVIFSIKKDQQDNAITVTLKPEIEGYDEMLGEIFNKILKYFEIGTKIKKDDIVLVKRRTNSTRTHLVGKYYKVESVEKNFINLHAYERFDEEHFVAVEYGDVEKVDVKIGDFVLGKERGVPRWKLDVFDGVDGHGHAVTKANHFSEIIPYNGNEEKLGQQ